MKKPIIREIARNKGISVRNLSKIELVRRIQKAEDVSDCFATIRVRECSFMNCVWRHDCSILHFKSCTLTGGV
jgi:hypothetical protein